MRRKIPLLPGIVAARVFAAWMFAAWGFAAWAFAAFAAEPAIHIPFEKYKLPNGMRVVLSRDAAVPVIAVYVIYDVGSRVEEQGHTGFAHLFEHMMFEGSKNIKKGEHFKYIQANGGSMNGSTHSDYTDYYETMPSNKLELALWLESDRMRGLDISPENLKNQQEAVKQERRLNFENRPYSLAILEKWPSMIFGNFHSAHSTIGSQQDLNAASVDDVSRFFATYYAPNNAVLVVAGDFQPADAKKMIAKYFGDIPSQTPPKKADLTETPRAAGKTETVVDQHARVPGVMIGWPGPPRHSQDWYALNMMDAVLTGGRSARLQLDMVKGKQSVLQYSTNLGFPTESPTDYKDPNEYAALLLYKPNFKPEEIVDQFQAELDRIANEGVDSAELDRVKAVLRYTKAGSLQTALERASVLGVYEMVDGKPELFDEDYTNLFKVTSAGMQAAVKKYLTKERRDVLVIGTPPQQPITVVPAPVPNHGGAK